MAKHKVVAPLNLHIAHHVLTDYIDFACSVRSVKQHGDDQVQVLAADVVEENGKFEHYSFQIALIIRCLNLIANHMIMIGHLAIVGNVGIK